MASFPQEIMTIIFSGLPVKSLLRFRCLSKFLCSIIDSPEFIKLHLERSVLIESDLCVVIDDLQLRPPPVQLMDLDMGDNFLVQLDRPLVDYNIMYRNLFGTCNGLVALDRDSQGIILRNPSTNRQRLVNNFWDNVITDPDKREDTILDGFGYDAVNDDYKLVVIRQCSVDQTAKAVVYSSRARSSKRLPDCPYVYSVESQNLPGIYVAGSLHWIIYKSNENNNDDFEDDEDFDDDENFEDDENTEEEIIALDVTTETFHVVPRPQIQCDSSTLGALGGCLAVNFRNSATSDCEIWVMKEYLVKGSWTKLVHISRVEQEVFGVPRIITRSLYLTRKGDRVLLEIGGSFLFWYNIVLQRIEYFQSFANVPTRGLYSQLMSRSLVSLRQANN